MQWYQELLSLNCAILKGIMGQLEDEGKWTLLRVAGHALILWSGHSPILWSGCYREKCLVATDQV